ncbi:MAG: MATE family efflux transporter [Candidatus Onthomonas sp.]|nr:MATE family efflux transporter [Candidatus Onthomonas sp.]
MAEQVQSVRENPLGYAPIPALIRKFAIPSMISLLVGAAYNITDQIFIGHVVGMLGNAATNVAFPTATLTTALAQLTGVGTAANFNLCMGAKNQSDAEKYIGTGLTMSVLLGLLLSGLILLFRMPVLLLCGATEAVLPYAYSYLSITAFGLPFLLFTNASSMLIRADGSPTYSMVCNVSGAILNIFLDWLFMMEFHWGIQGAAAATVTGQVISACLCIGYFPRFRAFPIKRALLRLRPSYIVQIAKLGTSNFINHTVMTLVNIVLNNTLTYYGAMSIYGSDIPLAVSGIVAKVNTILISCTVGLAHGCQPIFSFNMGAKNYPRIKETYKKAALAALCFSCLAFLAFQLFPRQITSLFGSGEELYYQFAEQYLRIYMMMVCITGIQPLTVNYFTSTGNVRQGIVLSLSRQGFFLIPLLLILPLLFGLNGVLAAGPIAEVMACVLSLSLIFRDFKRLDRLPQPA